MSDTLAIWLMIAITAVGSLAARASFFVLIRDASKLSDGAKTALGMVPPAAFAALVAPILLRPDGNLEFWSVEVLTAAVAMLVGVATRSVGVTIFVGLGMYALLA